MQDMHGLHTESSVYITYFKLLSKEERSKDYISKLNGGSALFCNMDP